jgi:hypothetical protein
MILSEKHKFIFIKGRKVASTSMEIALSGICGEHDIITPISTIDERHRAYTIGSRSAQNFGLSTRKNTEYIEKIKNCSKKQLADIQLPKGSFYNHMPLQEVCQAKSIITSDWTIFAIERCPYAKIISLANMHLQYKFYLTNGKPMISNISDIKDYIRHLIKKSLLIQVKNIDLYKTKDGEIPTTILHYENLEIEYTKLMKNFNVKTYPELKHYKKGLNSNKLNPTDIFTREQIQTINNIFSEEFEFFGYETF